MIKMGSFWWPETIEFMTHLSFRTELRISKISFYISSMYFNEPSYSTYLTKVNLSLTSPSFCFFSMGIFLPLI
jgi:hypothetical protein